MSSPSDTLWELYIVHQLLELVYTAASITCQACRKHFLSGTATGEGSVGSGEPSVRSAEKFFHLHFSVVWIGSRSTFVLCTALPRPYLAMGEGGAMETGFRV